MRFLNGSSKKAVLLGAVAVTGLVGVSQLAIAQEPNSNQGYFRGSPGCIVGQNERQHPTLCAALADLYRARQDLAKGDEARQDRINPNSNDSRNDRTAYQARQKAIRSIDAAIQDTRQAILVDRK